MIGRRLAHYQIIDLLGKGGMGRVYLAEDTKLQRKVALKLLPKEFASDRGRLERFRREARTMAKLKHPNVVTIYSVDEGRLDGGDRIVHFLAMEFLQGVQLSNLLRPGGLPLEQLLDLAIPLTAAIVAAHEKGVTHRDLKPGNVMVTHDGCVKVLDFGLAKMTDPPLGAEGGTQAPTATLTAEGKILGTVAYMSPEQAEGKLLDHRSDIFSLGVILSEMATGRRPFRGGSSARIMSAILCSEPDPGRVTELRPEYPQFVARIIRQCLEKDPKDRYQTARDVHNQLRQARQELLSGRPAEARPEPASPSIHSPIGGDSADKPTSRRDPTTYEESVVERHVRRTAAVLTWLGAGAATLAIVACLGFITSMAYRVSLGIPSGFSDDSISGYLVWGGRALIPGIFQGLVSVAVLLGLWGLVRLIEWGLRAVGVVGLTRVRRVIAGISGARLLSSAFGAGLVGLSAAIASQRHLLATIFSMDTVEASRKADLGLLSTDSTMQHHVFTWCFGFVIAIMVLAVIRARASATAGEAAEPSCRWALIGILAIVLVAATIMVLPWRLLWSNSREVAWCGTGDGNLRKAFIIASSTEGEDCSRWLYFPDTRERRSVACSDFDSSNGCQQSGLNEYVFGGTKPR